MLKEMPKVGDKVRCIVSDESVVDEGDVYEVIEVDHTECGEEATIAVPGVSYPWFIYGPNHADGSDLHKYEMVDESVSDAVNSPAHYKRGKFETIEVIEGITAGYADGFVAHCAGTAIKYIARAPYKHATPTEDLRKAVKYLEFAIKRLEAGASE